MADETPLPVPASVEPSAPGKSNPATMQYVLIGVGAILVLFIAWSIYSQPAVVVPPVNTTDAVLTDGEVPETLDDPVANLQALKSTLSKEKFLMKLYETNREEYNLYEKAAKSMGVTLPEVKQFFLNCCDLTSEEDIFSQLPPIPKDFSKVAYGVATGQLYQVGLLGPEYYKQPEFYTFVDEETGSVNRHFAFLGITDPNLQYWGDNGAQTYPSDQYTSISFSKDETFTAAVFVTNAWNIQNYVGMNFVADKEASKYFDITISEDTTGKPYFLLGPTFPRFHKDWATKMVIQGKLKKGLSYADIPHSITIGLNPVAPPKELNEKWADEHTAVYAPYGFLKPSDNYINLHIDITE